MAVVASATGAAVFGLSGVAAGVAGGALLGAGAGALYSGITGDGNVLNSALTGGLIGGAAGGLGAYFGPGLMGAETAGAAGLMGGGAFAPAAGSGASFAIPAGAAYTPALTSVAGANAAGAGLTSGAVDAALAEGLTGTAAQGFGTSGYVKPALDTATKMSGNELLGYGLAGTAALSLLGGMNQPKLATTTGTTPSYIRPYTYSSTEATTPSGESPYYNGPTYGENGLPILDTRERRYVNQSYTAGTPYQTPTAANGGLMAKGGPVERMSQNVMGGEGNMFPQSQQSYTSFATPSQMPVSAEIINSNYDSKTDPYTGVMMADGGVTYDPKTQTYSGLPSSSPANYTPAPDLSADLVSSLTPQWQAANPNTFKYDPKLQRYSAGIPSMSQLNAFKAEQDRQAAEAMSPFVAQDNSAYDGSSGANGGLMPQGLRYANGGAMGGQYNLGSYSDGGRLLKGPGDGVSDDIPAVIGDKQPARLADGEFVIPARIVSELGNGSTDAGAKRLYAMMDNIQAGRKKTIGKGNVAKDTKAKKHLLA